MQSAHGAPAVRAQARSTSRGPHPRLHPHVRPVAASALLSASRRVVQRQDAARPGVIVRTGADGVVSSARIGWRAPCGQGLRYSANTIFRKPFDTATADVIQDAGSYRVRLRGGLRARITGTFAGQRDPATDRWSGTWAVKVRVTRRGKTVDRCQLKRATWEAR